MYMWHGLLVKENPLQRLSNRVFLLWLLWNITIFPLLNCSLLANGPVIYTSEKEGSDESGDGSAQKPFKTVMQVCFPP